MVPKLRGIRRGRRVPPLAAMRVLLAWIEGGAYTESPFAWCGRRNAACCRRLQNERRQDCFRKQSRQPFQRTRCAHGEGDLLGGFELWRGFAIEIEGVRVETRVVGGNSERFAECLRYCSFRCECSACRRFPINVDDCRLTPLIADRSSLLQSFPYFFLLSFFLMDRASVFLHATT